MADTNHTNLAFTKAAFVFKDGLDKSRANKMQKPVSVTVKAIETPTTETTTAPPTPAAEVAHQARHLRRIRIARTVQHILTSILSIIIAFLQGKVFVLYNQTKSVPGAWPVNADLLPTLMLFATAIAALTIDVCALIAYFSPKTNIGKKAYSFAHSAYGIYTTIKGISYTFSAIVCKTGKNQGTSSGDLNDLWSWTCSSKGGAMSAVNQAHSNCIGSTVAWYLAMFNIGIEILGVIINQIAKQDAEKFKSQSSSSQDVSADVEKHDDADSDTKPLLSPAADSKSADATQEKAKDQPDDDFGSKFDDLSNELDDQLTSSLPKMSGSQS